MMHRPVDSFPPSSPFPSQIADLSDVRFRTFARGVVVARLDVAHRVRVYVYQARIRRQQVHTGRAFTRMRPRLSGHY